MASQKDINNLNADISAQKDAWWDAYNRNDQAGMDAAHQRAEEIRDSASSYLGIGRDQILTPEDDAIHNNTPVYVPAPSYSYGEATSSSNDYYEPYIPPKPIAPTPPPQAPPNPGDEPQFTKHTQQQLVKYEYVYGIKDLQIQGNEYAEKSIFVSKPMQVEGNVMQISLQAVEEHPLFSSLTGEATERQTSVEYYVSYVENPSLTDWHPILPEGEEQISSELLIFDTARTATLRFPALTSQEAKVFKNGIKYSNWTFTSGGTKIQLLEELQTGAVYTINYKPNADIVDPWNIDIYQKGLKTARQVDVFPNGTNHNKTLSLSKYPYIDYSQINTVDSFDPNTTGYRPITVTLKDAKIQGVNNSVIKEVLPYTGATTDPRTFNITDYKSKQWKQPKAYSLAKTAPYLNFEYYHEGSKLYFSETFNKADILTNLDITHGNAGITVEYDYLVSNFRIKIILRRTGLAYNSVSPIVHQYALKFKAMK